MNAEVVRRFLEAALYRGHTEAADLWRIWLGGKIAYAKLYQSKAEAPAAVSPQAT